MSNHADAHRRSRAVTPSPEAVHVDLVTPPLAHTALPSSATHGFFQEPPRLSNPFHDDFTFQRVLRLYLPDTVREAISPELSRFGEFTLSPEILRLCADAENNPPRVETLDSFGRPKNALLTAEGWRQLTAVHHREGLVAIGHQNIYAQYDRLHQFLKTFLWCPASGGVTCPAAMQDGAASLLTRMLSDPAANNVDAQTEPILRAALARLTSRDPAHAWTSGQWMTERPGGSDVRNTETQATYSPRPNPGLATDHSPLGPYSIHGFKWFSSATDANMTVLLAKTPGHATPSLFFAPVYRLPDPSPSAQQQPQHPQHNGITISRLKSKLGTRSLPTAELVLTDVRAHLLGREGGGVKEISTVLNITRVHNAVGATAAWSRALAVARAWSAVRSSGGRRLRDWEGHVRGLAAQTAAYHGATLGAFFAVGLLGRVEKGTGAGGGGGDDGGCPLFPAEPRQRERLLRLLTPVLKATTALRGIEGVRACMESLGGVGYLENSEPEINLARLLRDTMVLSIWEGTTEVMALDVVRVVKGRDGAEVLDALEGWAEGLMGAWDEGAAKGWVRGRMGRLRELAGRDVQEVTYRATSLLGLVEEVLDTVLVVEDARDGGDARTAAIARRWVEARVAPESRRGWKEDAAVDSLIVFGEDKGAKSRL